MPPNRSARAPWLRFILWNGGNEIRPTTSRAAMQRRTQPMKTLTALTTIGVTLLGLAACDSKVESARKEALESKADALENKAGTVRKDAKADADNLAKQAAMDADAAKAAAKARAEAEKKAAEETAEAVRKAGDQAAKDLEKKAKEAREQK
ncbi:MAG: hypothetical protein NTV08_03865 [Verrucomicrobia bacterium]|nr:hypothetical protein [Verrucomicrobiota bacterium]